MCTLHVSRSEICESLFRRNVFFAIDQASASLAEPARVQTLIDFPKWSEISSYQAPGLIQHYPARAAQEPVLPSSRIIQTGLRAAAIERSTSTAREARPLQGE